MTKSKAFGISAPHECCAVLANASASDSESGLRARSQNSRYRSGKSRRLYACDGGVRATTCRQ